MSAIQKDDIAKDIRVCQVGFDAPETTPSMAVLWMQAKMLGQIAYQLAIQNEGGVIGEQDEHTRR